MYQRRRSRVRNEESNELDRLLRIARPFPRTTTFCSYIRTITGSFDITVALHCLNPHAASIVWLSCFMIQDASSMSGTCSTARWMHQLRLQQSSRMDAQGASLMQVSQCWTERRKQN